MRFNKDTQDFYRRHRIASLLLGSALLATPMITFAGDGEVSTSETSRAQQIWQRLSERFDSNQDGQITAEEVPEESRFARMDRNGDQVVTEADFEGIEDRDGERMGRRGHRGHRGGGMKMMMAAADTDQDKKVSNAEWNAFVGGIDADGDGLLSETELANHHEAHRKAMTEHPEGGRKHHRKMKGFMDSDGDGQLETEDLNAAFAKLDRDGDGFLTEGDRPQRQVRGKRGERSARGERRRDGRRIGGHLMRLADINGDEQLTQAEWTGYLATLDSNTDGSLSRDELEVTRPADAPAPRDRADRFEPPALDVARLTETFSRRDADGNGVIEGDEWQRRGRRGERKGPRHGGPEARGESL